MWRPHWGGGGGGGSEYHTSRIPLIPVAKINDFCTQHPVLSDLRIPYPINFFLKYPLYPSFSTQISGISKMPHRGP